VSFLADEGVDRQIVERLRLDGHVVRYVAEMEPGIPDDVVLDLANEQSDVLLTADKDFGELVFRQHRLSSGVVLVRLAGVPSDRKAEIIASVINQHGEELPGAFAVLTPGAFRIRRLE
jgi:predicted nuclease of predicted toxin-antitoxin system